MFTSNLQKKKKKLFQINSNLKGSKLEKIYKNKSKSNIFKLNKTGRILSTRLCGSRLHFNCIRKKIYGKRHIKRIHNISALQRFFNNSKTLQLLPKINTKESKEPNQLMTRLQNANLKLSNIKKTTAKIEENIKKIGLRMKRSNQFSNNIDGLQINKVVKKKYLSLLRAKRNINKKEKPKESKIKELKKLSNKNLIDLLSKVDHLSNLKNEFELVVNKPVSSK